MEMLSNHRQLDPFICSQRLHNNSNPSNHQVCLLSLVTLIIILGHLLKIIISRHYKTCEDHSNLHYQLRMCSSHTENKSLSRSNKTIIIIAWGTLWVATKVLLRIEYHSHRIAITSNSARMLPKLDPQ